MACWSFGAGKILPHHLKKYSVILGISLITIVLYQMTFFVKFSYAQTGVYIVALAVFFHDLIRSKWNKAREFCLSNRHFFYGAAFWFLITLKAQVFAWDDFSWASFVKHVNHFGGYWNSSSAILPQGMRYFPGMILWESFFQGKELFNESALFFSVGLIIIAGFCVLSYGVNQTKTIAWMLLIYVFVVACFSVGLSSFSFDGAMGIILALSLCASYEAQKSSELLVSLIIAGFLAITKETGLCLALLPVFLVFLNLFKKGETLTKFLLVVGSLAFLGVNYVLWKNYLAIDPNIGVVDTKLLLDKFLSDTHQLSQRSQFILPVFFEALFFRPLSTSLMAKFFHLPFLNIIGSYFFWVMTLFILLLLLKDKLTFVATFFVGLAGYTAILLVTFLYFFSEYEGRMLASYERYMGVYFLAYAFFIIKLLFDKKLFFERRVWKLSLVFILLLPPSLSKAIPTSLLNPKKMRMRQEALPLKERVLAKTPPESRVWFIFINSNGFEAMNFRFEISPRRMNDQSWSIGEKYGPEDVWTVNYSLDEFKRQWENFDYMALGRIDEKFIKQYGVLFTSTPREGRLYQKKYISQELRVEEVQ